MATYEYRCPGCGPFLLSLPIGTAPARAGCPGCRTAAARVFTPPLLNRTPAALGRALAREEASRDRPEVVHRVPPAPGRARAPVPHPALARLPKP
jgi:putative FmdB family regulatory protein